jgi:chloramphenicol-sensitive protein RarD
LNRDDQHQSERASLRLGLLYGVLAYGAWGIVPLYFKRVAHVPVWDVLAHRVVWSVVFLLIPISLQHRWADVGACFRSRQKFLFICASTLAVGSNWFTFIWAVSHGKVLQSSLGYFMNPLVNVILGITFLKERLRFGQFIALILAAIGVGNLVWQTHLIPVISIVLAISFGIYALLRKTMPVGPLVGSFVETTLLFPFGLMLVSRQLQAQLWQAGSSFDVHTWGWLMCSGVVTAVPLLWFAAAARRLRLATMGFLQYLSPTGQFLLAVFLYHEPFDNAKLASFALIWIALAIYSLDSWRAYRASKVRGFEVLPAVAPE